MKLVPNRLLGNRSSLVAKGLPNCSSRLVVTNSVTEELIHKKSVFRHFPRADFKTSDPPAPPALNFRMARHCEGGDCLRNSVSLPGFSFPC